MIVRVLGFVAILALLIALLLYSQRRAEPLKVSGFIEADEIRLGSRVGGRVAAVHVEEGSSVVTGKLLVELEPFDLQARLAQAKSELSARRAEHEKLVAGFRAEEIGQAQAQLAQLTSQLQKLEAGPRKQEISAAQARMREANAQLELAQVQYRRSKSLLERNATSRDEFDRAETEVKAAQETASVRESELNQLLEGTRREDIDIARAQKEEAGQSYLLRKNGYRVEEIAAAAAALAAAEGAVRIIESQIAELRIVAPVNGTVEALDLQPGDLVAAGAPAMTVVDSSHLWVRTYVPENKLFIRLGQRLKVTVDSFPGEQFAGHVTFMARQAEFTPSNVQTPEDRSKQVFRVKVTLDEALDRLRPGMVADVWLEPAAVSTP